VKIIQNRNKGLRENEAGKMLQNFTREEIQKVLEFHKSIDCYEPTPLHSLENLAANLGVSKIFVKDESFRFGINAFKALGGSYAIGKYLAARLGLDISNLPYPKMISDEVKQQLGEVTFISATDGNHGRGVAWTANKLRQNCVIHMPKGSARERLENIRLLGARADITDLNYDDAVRLSNKEAEANGWVLVQDTSWSGYEDIPLAIVQGYTTFLSETFEQLGEENFPTHAFVQAGVGALATAFVAAFVSKARELGKPVPKFTVVEPDNAACIFATLSQTDSKVHTVGGDLKTIMAGLACGEPITIGVDTLANFVDFVVSAPDFVAAQGMRALSSPQGNDPRIVSGESGAAAFGLVYEILSRPDLAGAKELLGIDDMSKLFFVSTEGDTDKAGFKDVVINGAYQREEVKVKS
jgi:diaminopropionate ammonia-lyase